MDNEHLIESWVDWMRAVGRSPATIRIRRASLRSFAREYDLSTASMIDVAEWLSRQPGGPSRRQGHLSSLRSFYKYATAAGHLTRSPAALVPSVHVPEPDRRPVPEHVLARALAESSERTRLALLLGAYAGLRRTEIATLHSDWISDGWIRVTGKGGRVRLVPIHPLLRPRLAVVEGYAFPSRVAAFPHVHGETVADWITAALGSPWTAHSLRHRFATQAYRATRDIRSVQALLGHQSPATTSSYVRADGDTLTATVLAVA